MNYPTVTVGIPTYNRAALLKDTLESVLAQTYSNFRLVIGDNASTDETPDVVASYSDARIDYIRGERNIGMIGNFNRLIQLADTEFLMLLPDDDRLYPNYLKSVVDVLQRHQTVGLVHTAFDEIDADSRVQRYGVSALKTTRPLTVETGPHFIERSMISLPLCFSTATYRTCAIREAGSMIAGEELFADVPLVLRMALHWDIAYIDRPLVAFRLHDATQTRRLAEGGVSEPGVRDRLLAYGQALLDRRMRFVDDAALPTKTANKYRALAALRFLADRTGLGAPWSEATASFLRIARLYPRILTHPIALRFIAAQFGGRALRNATHRLASIALELRHTWPLRT
jgi:glycosyltransferase involved in cell wall biosynthesis